MIYPKELFEINFAFAQKIADLSHKSLEEVLFDHTILYRSFNLGRTFEADHPVWLGYLRDLKQTSDAEDFTYGFHLSRQSLPLVGTTHPTFGCFWYEVWPDRRIRIHFDNTDSSGYGPLSKFRIQARKLELRKMFQYIRRSVENPTSVVGRTWLYNMPAYRRLFPPSYLATAQVGDQTLGFRRIALWGQFLNNRGLIKDYLMRVFLDCLGQQLDLEQLTACFPFPVLLLETSINHFFEFYKIDESQRFLDKRSDEY